MALGGLEKTLVGGGIGLTIGVLTGVAPLYAGLYTLGGAILPHLCYSGK